MRNRITVLAISGLLWSQLCLAEAASPVVSIIIDDLGYHLKGGQQAVDLPGKLTYAFLPRSPYAVQLAERAHRKQKEIMLHLPMQSEAGKNLGPGALTECMDEPTFKQTVHENIAAVPHVQGFNNHMGSYLTKSRLLMRWLMQGAMFRSDLYFVDSRTTTYSVAEEEATLHGIAATRRDIFLDYEKSSAIVEQQLDKLIDMARSQGSAIAIGHPYPETITVLKAWLPTLSNKGVRLVPVSELIQSRQPRRIPSWHLSSYPSPRVVKSLKQ